MKKHRFKLILLFCCLGLAVALPAYCGRFLAPWQSRDFSANLLGNGSPVQVTVQNRAAVVRCCGQVLLQSEPGWLVQDALAGDLNRDGAPELLLLVWKRGSFGQYLPFWHQKNDTDFSQHIFIYGVDDAGTGLRPLWMSSALKPRVKAWSLADGTLAITTPEGEDTRWAWNRWGLVRTDVDAIVL